MALVLIAQDKRARARLSVQVDTLSDSCVSKRYATKVTDIYQTFKMNN